LGEETSDSSEQGIIDGEMTDFLPAENVPEEVQMLAKDMLEKLGIKIEAIPLYLHQAGHA
jgi:hypothetical protein